MRRLLFILAACLFALNASAGELRALGRGDVARMLAERQGKPVILTLWSVECPHCKATLRQLGALAQKQTGFDLLIINTDAPAERHSVSAVLAAHGLNKRDTWMFGDEAAERLRFEIDPRWGGELPRTYLHGRDGKVSAHSGPLTDKLLSDWLASNKVPGAKDKRT